MSDCLHCARTSISYAFFPNILHIWLIYSFMYGSQGKPVRNTIFRCYCCCCMSSSSLLDCATHVRATYCCQALIGYKYAVPILHGEIDSRDNCWATETVKNGHSICFAMLQKSIKYLFWNPIIWQIFLKGGGGLW